MPLRWVGFSVCARAMKHTILLELGRAREGEGDDERAGAAHRRLSKRAARGGPRAVYEAVRRRHGGAR